MPFVTIFKTAFVEGLRLNIRSNLPKYLRTDKWVLELASRQVRDLDTNIEIKAAFAFEAPDGEDLKDLENAIRLHKALRLLTPLQARNPRLWSRIAHVDGWSYMRERWHLERAGEDVDKGARFVSSRYFVAQNDSRSLLRNGIARLWWTAHMSYDPERNNPYELTSVLLSTLDITQQILERNMGRAPAILTGFLECLLQNKDLLLTGGDQNRARIRQLAKFLNMYGGVCLLDCLAKTTIIGLLNKELERTLAAENKRKAEKPNA
jgi:hypothetical protein